MYNIYILEILWIFLTKNFMTLKKSQCIKKNIGQISGDGTEPDKESQF